MSALGKFTSWTALAVLVVSCATAVPAAERGSESADELVRVERVEVLMSGLGPVVLLRIGNKVIPIFVDVTVAQSINGALSGRKPSRPLSHDLMHTVLEGLGAKVSQVVITLKGQTYYADLTVTSGEKPKVFDSRSSDAIALAIHFKAPIMVNRSLVDSVGTELDRESPAKRPNQTKL